MHSSRWIAADRCWLGFHPPIFHSNAVLGHALVDIDRGVRILAETSIRAVWCRDGSGINSNIARIIGPAAEKARSARTSATRLIDEIRAWPKPGTNGPSPTCVQRYLNRFRLPPSAPI